MFFSAYCTIPIDISSRLSLLAKLKNSMNPLNQTKNQRDDCLTVFGSWDFFVVDVEFVVTERFGVSPGYFSAFHQSRVVDRERTL